MGHVIFQIIGISLDVVTNMLMVAVTICGSIFLTYLPDDLQNSLRQFNDDLVAMQSTKLNARQQIDLTKQLTDMIHFYGEAGDQSLCVTERQIRKLHKNQKT